MPSLRFDSERDYARFLADYQGRAKRGRIGSGRAIAPQNKPTPTDATKRLLQAILDEKLPGIWCREFCFHEERNYRLDVACVDGRKLGIECDGAVHRIKKNFLRDLDKHNLLILTGWRYVRVTPAQVDNGEALALVRALVDGIGE
jgi:very-short-patch-repair endonuclease